MPVGPYDTFGQCVGAMKRKGHDDESARKICGKMEQESKMEATAQVPVDAIRWNVGQSSAFDVHLEHLEAANLVYDWVSRFVQVPVKKLFSHTITVPAVHLGSFLSALDDQTNGDRLEDMRNIGGERELPPVYDVIELNAENTRDFLVEGIQFFERSSGTKYAVSREPFWGGMRLTLYCAYKDREQGAKLLDDTWTQAIEKSFLKGAAFSISGKFLKRGTETWDDVFLSSEQQKPLERLIAAIKKSGAQMPNRGVALMGPPGTGKTLGCRVVKNSLTDATFIWISARDFYRMGTFGGLSMAYDLARQFAPSVICLEDVDNWLDRHSIDFLKTEMDGVDQTSGIATLLTTNFPERFPDALLDRPGRFHDVIQIGLPDEPVRMRMLERWVPSASLSVRKEIAKQTEGLSGAHIKELSRFAETLSAEDDSLGIDEAVQQALQKVVEQRELIANRHVVARPSQAWDADAGVMFSPSVASYSQAVQLKAVPFKSTPAMADDAAWDASAAEKRLQSWSGVDGDSPTDMQWNKYAQGFARVTGDGNKLGDFSLPHHDVVGGTLKVNFKGCAAAIAAVNGGRGKMKWDSDGERAAVYSHLARHYKEDFNRDAPELSQGAEGTVEDSQQQSPVVVAQAAKKTLGGAMDKLKGCMGQMAQDANQSDLAGVVSDIQTAMSEIDCAMTYLCDGQDMTGQAANAATLQSVASNGNASVTGSLSTNGSALSITVGSASAKKPGTLGSSEILQRVAASDHPHDPVSGRPFVQDVDTILQAGSFDGNTMSAEFITVTRRSATERNRNGSMVQIAEGDGFSGLKTDLWESQRGIWLFGHGLMPGYQLPIGNSFNKKLDRVDYSKSSKRMTARIFFSQTLPEAEVIAALTEEGILNCCSIQFLPIVGKELESNVPEAPEGQDATGLVSFGRPLPFDFLESDLYECSVVPIPADGHAIRKGIETGKIGQTRIVQSVIPALKMMVKDTPAQSGWTASQSGKRAKYRYYEKVGDYEREISAPDLAGLQAIMAESPPSAGTVEVVQHAPLVTVEPDYGALAAALRQDAATHVEAVPDSDEIIGTVRSLFQSVNERIDRQAEQFKALTGAVD